MLSDNIRIGVSVTIKNFKHYFINPRAFTFGYITRSDLVSLNIMGIEKTHERQRQLYLNETKKLLEMIFFLSKLELSRVTIRQYCYWVRLSEIKL